MPRTFAAVHLPEMHRERLGAHLAACRAAAPGLRWVRAEGLHLTLRFAGNTDEATVDRLRAALAGVRSAPFEVRLGDLGAFGGRAVSVLWIGLAAGGEPLTALAAACEQAARSAGLTPDERPYRPHLTLARAGRVRAPLPELPPLPDLPAFEVDEFALFDSRSGPGGAVYSPLETYPL